MKVILLIFFSYGCFAQDTTRDSRVLFALSNFDSSFLCFVNRPVKANLLSAADSFKRSLRGVSIGPQTITYTNKSGGINIECITNDKRYIPRNPYKKTSDITNDKNR